MIDSKGQKLSDKSKLVFELNALQIDYSKEKEESFIEYASKKYNVPKERIEFKFIPISYNSDGKRVTLNNDIIENIQDPKFQVKLFEEYIKLKGIEDVDMNSIKDIDNEVNSYVNFDVYKNYKRYKFKYVKWSNYLSYGKDNFFDFTKLSGLVLLNGYPENQCGKTTFAIDLLRFALFGKADKAPTLDSVFNKYLPEETEVYVEACIEIDGIDYVIKRIVTRPPLKKRTSKSKSTQTIEYYKIINGNTELIENCQDESILQTNKIIKECIGNVEDFNLIMSSTSYSLGELLRLGQSDRGRLFSKWLGLLSIEKKEEISKKIYKEDICKTFKTQSYNSEKLIQEIEDFEVSIKKNKELIILKENSVQDIDKKISLLDIKKTDLLSSKKEVKPELEKLDVSTIENKILSYTNKINNKRSELHALKDEYILKLKDASFDKEKLDSARKERDVIKEKISEIKVQINSLKELNLKIQKLIEAKICPTCGNHIDEKAEQNEINSNKNKINELINNGISLKERLDKIEEEILNFEKEQERFVLKSKYELKMIAMKSDIDLSKNELENEMSKKNEYEKNIENLEFNNRINLDVNNISISISTEQKYKETLIREIQSLKSDINNYEKSISDREKLIELIDKENKIKRNWSIYHQLIGKDGIVKIVLKKALPIINNEIKRLLDGIVDFSVILSISDDNKVCIDLVKDGQRLDMGTCGSGFEGTMAALALRSALGNMATMPKPNFIVFDEIINTVGNENMENIHKLFLRIISNYDFIIHITHLEQIYDWHNYIVTVTKDNNISKITN